MEKILALMLALLSLLSVFCMSASAAVDAATDDSVVMKELAQLKINGEPFDQSKYPVDQSRTDVEVLFVAEVGFKSITNSSNYGFYIYLYNPGCIKFENSPDDHVEFGLNMVVAAYNFYGLELASKSNDNRFLKYKVTSYGSNVVKQLWSLHENPGERVYNIPGIFLSKEGEIQEFVISRMYIFTGYDFDKSLNCEVRDGEVLPIKLYDTTWVSPNAGKTVDGNLSDEYDHYEIHSVYFKVKKSVLERYGYISSIRASYDSVKLTPIIVTREGVFDDVTRNMIQNGQKITEDTDVMDLVAGDKFIKEEIPLSGGYHYADWIYTDKENIFDDYRNALIYERLAYLIESNAIPEDFDLGDLSQMTAFTSEKLEKLYKDQVAKGIDASALYTEYRRNLDIDYTDKDLFNLETYEMSHGKYEPNFWQRLFGDKDVYLTEDFLKECKKIEVIENPVSYSVILQSEYAEYSKNLFINACDLDAFSKVCAEAAMNDEVVVILRYAIADYRCTLLQDVWEMDQVYIGPIVGYSIEKSAMLNVSIAHIAFTSKRGTVVIPTVSNTVNSFGDGIVYDIVGDLGVGKTPSSLWQDILDALKGAIKKIVFLMLIIALIILAIFFLPPVIRLCSATNSAVRQRRRDRRADKESRKHNENKNE